MGRDDYVDRSFDQGVESFASAGSTMYRIAVAKPGTEIVQSALLTVQYQHLCFVFVQRYFPSSKGLCRIAHAVLAPKEYSLGFQPDCRSAATECWNCDAAHIESAGRVTFAESTAEKNVTYRSAIGFAAIWSTESVV